jgi:hypothetical protein
MSTTVLTFDVVGSSADRNKYVHIDSTQDAIYKVVFNNTIHNILDV